MENLPKQRPPAEAQVNQHQPLLPAIYPEGLKRLGALPPRGNAVEPITLDRDVKMEDVMLIHTYKYINSYLSPVNASCKYWQPPKMNRDPPPFECA